MQLSVVDIRLRTIIHLSTHMKKNTFNKYIAAAAAAMAIATTTIKDYTNYVLFSLK